MTHDIGNPPAYRRVCREMYRHERRLRYEQPIPHYRKPHWPRLASVLWTLLAVALLVYSCTTWWGW